jgi:hypothetical protein
MALLRRGDLSVTAVSFAVGCSSLGTLSTRFTELVGVPPDRKPLVTEQNSTFAVHRQVVGCRLWCRLSTSRLAVWRD